MRLHIKLRLYTFRSVYCANVSRMKRAREIANNEYVYIYSNEIADFEQCILFIKLKFMDYLLTTSHFYWTIKRTMSRSHVKRYIIPLCFSFWNVAGHSLADNRVNVNRHDAQCERISF